MSAFPIGAIEDAIVAEFESAGLAASIDLAAVLEGTTFPIVYVAATAGQFSRAGQVKFSADVTVNILILGRDMEGDAERMTAMRGLLDAVVSHTANMQIPEGTKLTPTRIRRIDSDALAGKGMIAWQVDAATRITTTPAAPADTGELVSIAVSYFLEPDDGAADAADTISLEDDQ